MVEVMPALLGRTAALVLVPAILVGGIVLLRGVFKRPTSSTTFFVLTVAIWMVVMLSNLRVSLLESSMQNSLGVEFAPDGCEYSVSFPSDPETYMQQKATADGALLPLYGAQLVVGSGTGQIRAECASAGGADLKQFSPENFVGYMTEIAKDIGLARPSFEIQETPLGNVGTITGVKDSERGRITVRVVNVVGDTSILTLYLMAFSTDFQTPEMERFVQSVERQRSTLSDRRPVLSPLRSPGHEQ